MAYVQKSDVSNVTAGSGTQVTDGITLGAASTAGNTLVFVVSLYGYYVDPVAYSPATITVVGTNDTLTLTINHLFKDWGSDNTDHAMVCIKPDITGGDTAFTVTYDYDGVNSLSSVYWRGVLLEYDGVVADPLDQQATSTASLNTGNITPTVSNSTAIALMAHDDTNSVSAVTPSEYTEREDSTGSMGFEVCEKTLTSTATENESFTFVTGTPNQYGTIIFNLEHTASGADINYNYVLQIT